MRKSPRFWSNATPDHSEATFVRSKGFDAVEQCGRSALKDYIYPEGALGSWIDSRTLLVASVSRTAAETGLFNPRSRSAPSVEIQSDGWTNWIASLRPPKWGLRLKFQFKSESGRRQMGARHASRHAPRRGKDVTLADRHRGARRPILPGRASAAAEAVTAKKYEAAGQAQPIGLRTALKRIVVRPQHRSPRPHVSRSCSWDVPESH